MERSSSQLYVDGMGWMDGWIKDGYSGMDGWNRNESVMDQKYKDQRWQVHGWMNPGWMDHEND